jgi:4-amino-4-deoxy-L-arabinose transferase-like glycosyltransferase
MNIYAVFESEKQRIKFEYRMRLILFVLIWMLLIVMVIDMITFMVHPGILLFCSIFCMAYMISAYLQFIEELDKVE